MPLDTLQRPARPPVRAAVFAAPPRLRPKGPPGADLCRQPPTAAGRPRQSAVERLEADKAKYVKSEVALSRRQPIRPPDARKPPPSPDAALRPTRRTQAHAKAKPGGVQLDLEHLTNLISGVADGPPCAAVNSEGSEAPDGAPAPCCSPQKKERPCPPPRPSWSSPAKVRLKCSGGDGPGGAAAGTVRRVDVLPQAGPVRAPCRAPQYIRQPLQPLPLHLQPPLRSAASHLRLFHPRTTTTTAAAAAPPPLKPVVAPSKPDGPPSTPPPAPPTPILPAFPPPSPAFTRLSPSSSRKRPSLARSKSDMSDRFSRAGTELERFFNLCGLDPADLQDLAGSRSDIVSLARFRSVSAPGSECAASGKEDEEEEEEEEEEVAGNAAGRVPYGVSVIERNARVIKWLYGLRQAMDNANKSTNL